MAKAKYKYNPETLSYVRLEHNFKTRFPRIMFLFFTSLVMSIIMTGIILQFYETPKTRNLERENQRLLTQYELMYKILGMWKKCWPIFSSAMIIFTASFLRPTRPEFHKKSRFWRG
jgi:hypothetical protein